jgi:type III restriction enzyme
LLQNALFLEQSPVKPEKLQVSSVVIETKGSHLDNTDSSQKIRLAEKWASKAGDKYRYFMVFDKEIKMEGAKTLSQIIEILKDMK